MMQPIQLFPAMIENNFVSSVVMSMRIASLVSLAETACLVISMYTSPHSASFVKPQDNVGQSFDFQSEVWAANSELPPSHYHGQRLYLRMMDQLDILLEYVRLKNQYPDASFLGEEHFTSAMIYHTLHNFQVWKDECNADTIRINGEHFGSNTGWRRLDVMSLLKEWPDRYRIAGV